jgi:valyl-tRNA synthetase
VTTLCGSNALTIEAIDAPRASATAMTFLPSAMGPVGVGIPLKGIVTKEKEHARIEREKKRLEKEIAVIDKKLGAKGFVERAPKEVVEETNAQKAQLVSALARLEEAKKTADEL